jgi:hypothetical protein
MTQDPESNSLMPDSHNEIETLENRIHEMRRTEVSRWADAVAEGARLADEIERMKATVSWRVTAPLRAVRRRQLGS